MPNRDNAIIVCPICDEPSKRDGRPIYRARSIIYPWKCIMGHTFYTKEEVPNNYGAFQEFVEEVIEKRQVARDERRKRQQREYARKDKIRHRKKYAEKRRQRDLLLKEERKRIQEDRKVHPELYDPEHWKMGRHYRVIKKAGEKGYRRIENEAHKKKVSKGVKKALRKRESERKRRRDEYLKGGLMSHAKGE